MLLKRFTIAGQGFNLGIRDVASLAEELCN